MQELLENSLDGFRMHLEKQGRSVKTITSYTCSVSLFFSLDYELSVENLKSYREYLLKNYQFNTVNARIYGMNRYLSYLQENGCLPSSLMLSYPELSAAREPVDLLSVKKTRDGSYRMQSVKERNMYWYFVIRFLGATGARVSELLQIKIEDLRLGYLDLYTKGGKIRRLYFPRSLCAEAIPWFMEKGIKSGFIFLNRHGNLITPRGIELRLKHFAKLYKINPKTVYPHSFRHRFAKNFLKRFNDISLLADLMGHDSIETTRIYLTRSSQEQKALLDRIITW